MQIANSLSSGAYFGGLYFTPDIFQKPGYNTPDFFKEDTPVGLNRMAYPKCTQFYS